MIVAIIANEKNPEAAIHLVESDQRKATFLRTALRETGVSAEIHAKRIGEIPSLDADVLSARALAPLPKLIEFTHLHRKTDGTSLFPKGAKYQSELDATRKSWHISCDINPSKTDAEAVILKIGAIERV